MMSDVSLVALRDLRSGREQVLTADEVSIVMLILRDLVRLREHPGNDEVHLAKWEYVTGLKVVSEPDER